MEPTSAIKCVKLCFSGYTTHTWRINMPWNLKKLQEVLDKRSLRTKQNEMLKQQLNTKHGTREIRGNP